MQKGLQFKLLTCKDISGVLAMIGVHPAITPDAIEKPTSEVSMSAFQHLAEFAYEMDPQQLKALLPRVYQLPAEIYTDALDVLTVFRLTRRLAQINHIDDFGLKDLWDPQPKRFRTVLSGVVNFCRFKEVQAVVTNGMKENLQAQDGVRVTLVQASNQLEVELAAAQEQHSAELHEMWVAENDAQELRTTLERLRRQKQSADQVLEETESKLLAMQQRTTQIQDEATAVKEQIAGFMDQIAESPQGLEDEIHMLQQNVQTQRVTIAERTDIKRTRMQRDNVLGRLMANLETYGGELSKVGQAAATASAARERSAVARKDLGDLRKRVESVREEAVELTQAVAQTTDEIQHAKEDHQTRLQQLEQRRQQALVQHGDLQARRSEEQRQHHALQAQRLELEAELASIRRFHMAEMSDLRAKHQTILERSDIYDQQLDHMFVQHDEEVQRARSPSGIQLNTSKNLGFSPTPPGCSMLGQHPSSEPCAFYIG